MRAIRKSIPNLADLASAPGRCSTAHSVVALAGRYGLRLIEPPEAAHARGFAAARLGEAVASAETLATIQAATGAALFGAYSERDELTGVFAGFPLRDSGARLCAQQRFNAIAVDPSLVSAPGELPFAWYGWGFVAATKIAAWAVVSAARAIQSELFWAVPAYARAVSPDGLRVTTKIGYRPLSADDRSFVWIPPRQPCAIEIPS